MIENGSEVQLMIIDGVTIPVVVMDSVIDKNNVYHYTLQGQLGDGNTVATVIFTDVVEQLLILKA